MISRKALFLAGASLCVSLCGFSQVIISAQNGSWSNPTTWVGGVVPTWSNCTSVSVDHSLVIDGDVSISNVNVSGTLSILTGGDLTLRQRNGSGSMTISPLGNVSVHGTLTGRDSVSYVSSASNLRFESGSTFRLLGSSRAAIPFASWNENSTFLIAGFVGSGYIAIAYSNRWKQRFGNVIYDCPLQTAFVDLNGYLRDIAGDFNVRNTNGQALRLSTTQKSEIHIGGDFIINGNSELWFNTTADSMRLYVNGNFEYRSQSTGPSYFATRGRCWIEVTGDLLMDSRGPLRFCSGSADSTGIRRTTLRLHNNFTINSGTLISPAPGRAIIVFDGPGQLVNTRPGHYNGTFDFHIRPGATVSFNDGAISNSTGNFFVRGHLKLGSTHPAGALQTGAAGNIQTKGTRNYYPGATIEYSGATTQYVGAGHPFQPGVNFIANAPELVLLQNISAHRVEVRSGVLNFSSYQCDLKGDLEISPGADVLGGRVAVSGAGDQIISANGISLHELIVDNAASDIVLNSPLRVANLLEIRSQNTHMVSNGNLILTSSDDQPGGTASVGPIPEGSMVVGDVTVQRFMQSEGRIYRYISSPVNNATVASLMDDFSITGNFTDPTPGKGRTPTLFFYNAGTTGVYGWNAYPAAGLANQNSLAIGRGYAAFIRLGAQPITWDVTGPLNQGVIDLPITFNPAATAYQGWNLVGNPYAATIDWSIESGWEKSSDLSTVFAIRNNGEGRFHYSDGQIGDLEQPHIASGQAFWVRASTPDPFLRINESAKTTQDTEFFRAKEDEKVSYIRLTFSGNRVEDQSFLRTREGALRSYDRTDAGRMANDVASISFVTADSVPVAINAIDSIGLNELFALKLEFARGDDGRFVQAPQGEYSISLNQFGLLKYSEVFLVDRYVVDTVALDQYHFTITDHQTSYASDRFALIVKTPALLPPTLAVPTTVCHNADLQVSVTSPGSHGAFSLDVGDSEFPIDTTLVTIPARLVNDAPMIFVYGENIYGRTLIDTIRVNILPAVPKPVIVETISCTPGPARIEVAAKGQSHFIWFKDDSLRSELSVSATSFITPSIDSAAVFYVATLGEFNCRSEAERVEIAVAFPDSLMITLSNGDLISNIGVVDWYQKTYIEASASLSPDSPGIYRAVAERQGCRQEAQYPYEPPPPVEISPVPFANFITIKAEPGVAFSDVTVINTTGSQIFYSKLEAFPLTIDTSHIPPGIYFVQLSEGEEKRSFRIVK
jgi:hypothetical protein